MYIQIFISKPKHCRRFWVKFNKSSSTGKVHHVGSQFAVQLTVADEPIAESSLNFCRHDDTDRQSSALKNSLKWLTNQDKKRAASGRGCLRMV